MDIIVLTYQEMRVRTADEDALMVARRSADSSDTVAVDERKVLSAQTSKSGVSGK